MYYEIVVTGFLSAGRVAPGDAVPSWNPAEGNLFGKVPLQILHEREIMVAESAAKAASQRR